MNLHELIDRLHKEHTLTKGEFITLIKERDEENASYLASLAREEAVKIYGNGVFPRGLVEFTNYCKNNCYYCCRPCLRPFQPFLQTRPTSSREEEPEL